MKNRIAIQASNNIGENKEIIKILKSLGGKNEFLIGHANQHDYYYIREDNLIECSDIYYCYKHLKGYRLYTLEEYKKEFMENKEIKIITPEGYEIDKENSSFEKIVFKKIEEKLTYEDIAEKLFKDEINYCIAIDGSIKKSYTDWKCSNTALTQHQLERLLAINKLINVAYYLNDGWEPDWNSRSMYKYYLSYDYNLKDITVTLSCISQKAVVYFKSKELAQQALKILGEETIKLALGVI